ncbi:MAG: hypothetical protein WC876_01860 [Candidatus Thermoplasmatota archaeon]|jgi:hypothetical protein
MITRTYSRPTAVRLHLFLSKRTGGPKKVWAWPVVLERRCRTRRPRPIELLTFRHPRLKEAFAHG